MSLIYRAVSLNSKVAELYVETASCILCTLTDKNLKTESRIECSTLKQAERLIEQFLRIHNSH